MRIDGIYYKVKGILQGGDPQKKKTLNIFWTTSSF